MKPLLAVALLALLPVTAHAQTKKPTPEQLCELAGTWAAVVMQARQNGHPVSSVLQTMGNAPGGSRQLVIAAYEEPRYSTVQMQQKAKQDFQNAVELDCFKKIR
ncbi:MAG: hypothetical protein J0I42_00835 [Bosea sp.]|uniref:hypothetical protein n=1 Tax=Bosea sp. (in: a-proteobacteria) TaxID=1871050 RepID=UPI001AD25EBB|nr:hypothetical protein [Bosea sp. (in: a-proteobacteria)]MBN9450468.1 hypothetical protein [Bosea sp. (in: a-proteobacteria)]